MSMQDKALGTLPWVPSYLWQRLARRSPRIKPIHLVIALADHFEPAILPDTGGEHAARAVQERRLDAGAASFLERLPNGRTTTAVPSAIPISILPSSMTRV